MSCCIVFCPPFYPAAYAQGTPWVDSCCYLLKLRLNHPKMLVALEI